MIVQDYQGKSPGRRYFMSYIHVSSESGASIYCDFIKYLQNKIDKEHISNYVPWIKIRIKHSNLETLLSKFKYEILSEIGNGGRPEDPDIDRTKEEKKDWGSTVLILIESKILITLDRYFLNTEYLYSTPRFYYHIQDKELVKKIESEFIKLKNKRPKVRRLIYYIIQERSGALGFEAIHFKEKVKIDFKNYYNDDFNSDLILRNIKKNKNGLILLGGEPGTGKSTYIRWLISQTTRKVVFIPSYMLSTLENPSFMSFTLRSLRDCILIIEDSERVLLSRNSNQNASISTLLNLSSGTLGLTTNITVIATYNTKEKIDTALLRKGRLIYQYSFSPLPIEKCNIIAKNLGYNISFDEPKTLAEIFNLEENGKEEVTSNRIGFLK